jgi:hypothetical protein
MIDLGRTVDGSEKEGKRKWAHNKTSRYVYRNITCKALVATEDAKPYE